MGTNTGIGIGIGIPFKNFSSGGRQPLPPDLKASLKGVWIAYGKSNNDADRSIVKNLVDLDNPFIISNAAFKLNSGFGKYEVDFTSWIQTNGVIASSDKVQNSIIGRFLYFNTVNKKEDVPSFKVNITLGQQGKLQYNYIKEDGTSTYIVYSESGIYTIPASYFSKYTGGNAWFGFYQIEGTSIIEQIPSLEGAFVTDGVDDLITSTKTVQEMLGGSNEITVVSMIHQIELNKVGTSFTNYCRKVGVGYVRNETRDYGTTGIYGWSISNVNNSNSVNRNLINNILGDKELHSIDSVGDITNSIFSVNGYENASNSPSETSQLAWYWTIIANKVLTTDQINQVIAYFNLDKTLKPDILCNITKQGITNDNHADFNDKLIDYSGNGRDIQMNNLAWKGGSGIAAKPFETIKDYTILSDEARQELTIYNEFSYKVKSNTPNHYWVVQSIIKDNTSYQVTIITDKDCYWINSTSFTNNEGNKESIRKEYPVKANTPTQVTICGLNEFEYPEDIEPTTAVSYVNLNYAGEVTVTFIPSCKGGLLLDGVNDFGQFVGDLGLKDYTLIMNRAYNNLINNQVPLISSNIVEDQTPFIVEHWNTGSNAISFSYGASRTTDIPLDINKKIVYQSTYSYMGYVIPKGNAISTGNGITLGKFGNGVQYSAICLWSLMLFPYSMSEFLIERQLKKHKLGTLYPDMVEFRPVIKANNDYEIVYTAIIKPDNWQEISIGDYVTVGKSVAIQIKLNLPLEVTNVSSNSLADVSFYKEETGDNVYTIYGRLLDGKSPQKINITIDEYIRFEDIVQPYPVLLRFKDENGNEVSWGGKFKVGSTITRIGSAADSNLLPNIYNIFGLLLNGNQVTSSKVIVEKTMVFKAKSAYIFDNNEPKCILSPRLLRIPNSSYKILGYIPDISGHGNHGVIHNSAYAEGSGVNEDGSYQFDGVDDFVTIPTIVGGKQVLMKMNWQNRTGLLYDQRKNGSSIDAFAILNVNSNNSIAYNSRNTDGETYIDGILNKNIVCPQLYKITHSITIINQLANKEEVISPTIGSDTTHKIYFSQMSLYDFMLFDNISTDDKIKELNEYVGIEAKVELPPYYWDAYGKSNLDEDRDSIKQRGVAVGDYDLTNTNFAYDKMSGFGGYILGKFTNSWSLSNNSNSISIVARNPYDITLKKLGENSDWEFNNTELKIISNPVSVKFKSDKNIRFTCDYHYYTVGGNSEGAPLGITSKDLIANEDTIITISPISQENIDKYNIDINRGYYLIYFQLSLTLVVNEEVTIEMLPLHPNGLVYDGVSDFTNNKNIPILTDFTFIIKREILGLETNESMLVIKGDKVYNNGIGNAFILEHNNNGVNYVYSYGKLNQIKRDDSKIIYLTPESYNGNPIIKGENGDNLGLILSRYWKGIIYKTILYSKTISLLEINFLKNLMEKDEIIDLNNPIFIKNE